jgi:hypothetical protein
MGEESVPISSLAEVWLMLKRGARVECMYHACMHNDAYQEHSTCTRIYPEQGIVGVDRHIGMGVSAQKYSKVLEAMKLNVSRALRET